MVTAIQTAHWNQYYTIDNIVLQPTTFCNLDCAYCYLPLRDKNIKMKLDVANAVARSIYRLNLDQIVLTWHCGEPMATGLDYFALLIEPFTELAKERKILNVIQTNATIINDDWCKFIAENNIYVSLSIDGDKALNDRRVYRNGKPAFDEIVKGINKLREHQIEFSIICVVSSEGLESARHLYNFLADFDAAYIAFNIEETLGVNTGSELKDTQIKKFWSELFDEYRTNTKVQVREFRHILSWLKSLSKESEKNPQTIKVDFIPTINANGDVVVLSPEFLDMNSQAYENFVVGNILHDPLDQILQCAFESKYVQEFAEGRHRCSLECNYFSSCGGGCAANKYFENGELKSTKTAYCRHSEQLLADAVIESL